MYSIWIMIRFASDSCLVLDYVCIINFYTIIIINWELHGILNDSSHGMETV